MTEAAHRLWRRVTGPGAPLRRLARRLGLSRWRPGSRRSALAPAPRAPRPGASGSPDNFGSDAADLPGALLVGHPYGVLGVGEFVRASATAFAAAEIPFHIRNTYGWGEHQAGKHPHFGFWDRLTTGSPHPVNILHINADEMAEARRHLGDAFFTGRYNIAAWHWELSRFPEAWLPALEGVDELWASSRFIQHALAERARVPVVWMPHPVDVEGGDEIEALDAGLPEDAYLFLAVFDFTSYVSRKNPLGAVRAFLQAFPPGAPERVGLVLKANGATARPGEARAFLASPELRDARITVINEALDRRQMIGLMKRCHCFVSLHRSEGFGRGIAEMLLLEKPVIVTGYSGNVDFSNPQTACLVDYQLVDVGPDEYPHAAGQQWADPDLEQAAWYMRRLVNDPGRGTALAQRGRELVEAQHGVGAVGRRYRTRLEKLGFLPG